MKSINYRKNANLMVLAALLLISACGGGSSNSSSSSNFPTLITASAIVDVNADGKNDVIIGSQGDGYSSPLVLINDGTGGSFTVKASAIPAQYKGANGSAVDIQSGDFNNDGNVDLLLSTVDTGSTSFYGSSQIQLYLGAGDGTFTDATSNITNNTVTGAWLDHIRVADFDGDGYLDFAITSTNGGGGAGSIYLNDQTGKFAPASVSVTYGGMTSTQPALNATDLFIGDINGDAKPDLFAPFCSCSYINNSTTGALAFTEVASAVGSGLQYGVLLDIDGDNVLDMVASSDISGSTAATASVIAAKGDGTGNFTLNNALLSPQPNLVHGRQFLAADLNADGKQDVLIADHGYDQGTFPGARNWLLINNGTGVLVDKTSTNLDLLPGYTHQASIGDLNADGKPDIFLNNMSACDGSHLTCTNEPRFWLNDGTGSFTSYNPTI